jgi:hypothetical protein
MRNEQDMNSKQADPLGLAALPPLDPDFDGWPEIRQALEAGDGHRPRWRQTVTWLAAAASVVLALALIIRQGEESPTGQPGGAQTAQSAEAEASATVDSLIAMSQTLERQVEDLRDNTVSMPASSAAYVAELEDLVAQVDQQLSYSPDSLNLWGQRINLLLDLAQIYQNQWERDYGLMASL